MSTVSLLFWVLQEIDSALKANLLTLEERQGGPFPSRVPVKLFHPSVTGLLACPVTLTGAALALCSQLKSASLS